MGRRKIISTSPEETKKIGEKFAEEVKEGVLYLLMGELGTGKTTFVKGLARKFGIDENEVQSPSFTLMNLYEGEKKIYHFDLYRLQHSVEAEELGFDDIKDGIIIIEWPKIKVNEFLKKFPNKEIKLNYGESELERVIELP